jgi:glycerol-3-phosphate O-acyltransferase/dihydroxyacetone phosphate acyltransferase
MQVPLLYRVSKTIIRTALGVYFRRVEVVGSAHVPPKGPIILAANHPQSITDALVLGVHTKRMVHYLAHSGIFSNSVKSWFLRDLGVIPVYRRADVEDAAAKNVDMFSACERAMADGKAIGIFPEGVSMEERRLQKLKTGAARIALQSEQQNGWTLGVEVIPVGINFESSRGFRSQVLMSFGEPIVAGHYRRAYESDPIEAVTQLTTVLEESIRRLVVDVDRAEFAEIVLDVERMYKGDLLARAGVSIPGESKFQKEQWVAREIPRALDYLYDKNPVVVWRLAKLLREYRRKLDRFRLQDDVFQEEKKRTVPGEAARFTFFGALGLPLAVWGTFWNVIPYKVTGWVARRVTQTETQFHLYQLSFGAVFYLLYYVPLLLGAYRILGLAGSIAFAATLPPTGFYVRAYGLRMGHRWRRLRLAWLQLAHGLSIERLRQLRQRLIDEMDTALDSYMAARSGAPDEAPRGEGDGQP